MRIYVTSLDVMYVHEVNTRNTSNFMKLFEYVHLLCLKDVDECEFEPSPCQNGATCINTMRSYVCDCETGWIGYNCSEGK